MADEVLDSWEDMIDENGVLDKKMVELKLNEKKEEMRSNAPIGAKPINTDGSGICAPNWADESVWPSIGHNNRVTDNCNSIKILKRPTNATTSPRTVDPSANCANDLSNSGQITLEDNTRTQYVPQLRILKRNPNKDSSDRSVSNDGKSLNANKSQSNNKTYEEREAEYARARLRIFKESAPQETTNSSTSGGSPVRSSAETNSCNALSPENRLTKLGTNDTNVPIIRLPIAPDGTKGFNRALSPQNR